MEQNWEGIVIEEQADSYGAVGIIHWRERTVAWGRAGSSMLLGLEGVQGGRNQAVSPVFWLQ